MKAIEEMTKQEVIDEITSIERTLNPEEDWRDSSDRERLEDLYHALTHNYPHLIH